MISSDGGPYPVEAIPQPALPIPHHWVAPARPDPGWIEGWRRDVPPDEARQVYLVIYLTLTDAIYLSASIL